MRRNRALSESTSAPPPRILPRLSLFRLRFRLDFDVRLAFRPAIYDIRQTAYPNATMYHFTQS